MLNRILLFSLVLCPLAIFSPGPAVHGQRIAFTFVAWLCFASYIKDVWLKWLIVYITCWQAYSAMLWMFGGGSFQQYVVGFNVSHKIVIGILIYWLALQANFTKKTFYNFVCIATIIQVVVALLQIGGVNIVTEALALFKPNVKDGGGFIYGSLGVMNGLSTWLAITLPFFFRRYWAVAVPFICFLTLYMHREMGVLASIIAIVVYSRNAWLLVLPTVFVLYKAIMAGGIINAVIKYGGTRLDNWLLVYERISSGLFSVLFGFGGGVDVPMFPIHNEFINLWFMFGAIGVAVVCGFLATMPQKDKMLSASFFALLTDSLGFYSMRVPPVALLVLIMLGVMKKDAKSCRR